MSEQFEGQRERYRITFEPEAFDVVRAVAAERIEHCLRGQDVPRESDVKIIGLREPYLLVPSRQDVTELAERFREFHDSTDYAASRLLVTAPEGMEGPMMEERLRLGSAAERLAGKTQMFVDMYRDLDRLDDGFMD